MVAMLSFFNGAKVGLWGFGPPQRGGFLIITLYKIHKG